MAKVKVWLPRIFDEVGKCYRIDGPGHRNGELWVSDFVGDNADGCGDSSDKLTGKPFGNWALIEMDEKDVPDVRAWLQENGSDCLDYADAPERDRMMYEMALAHHSDWSKSNEFFGAVDTSESDATRKRIVKDLIIQAVARGLAPDKAEAVCVSSELESTSKTENIDSELYDAAVFYAARRLNSTAEAARNHLNFYLERNRIE